MKFKFYDILAHLIPGFIIYLVYLEFTSEDFNKDLVVPATAISFALGYFVNALASWLEDFYYWTWGGKPSNRLLDGKDIWKVRFYEHERVKSMLQKEAGEQYKKNDELFNLAMRYATPEVNSRVSDFNTNYAFSRVILTTVLIASGVMMFLYYDSYKVYLFSFPLIIAAWYRCKQRGYYFVREVLRTYLLQKSKMKRPEKHDAPTL